MDFLRRHASLGSSVFLLGLGMALGYLVSPMPVLVGLGVFLCIALGLIVMLPQFRGPVPVTMVGDTLNRPVGSNTTVTTSSTVPDRL